MGGPDSEWAQQRSRAIASHGADLARREAADAAAAEEMLRGFLRAARDRGLPPVALVARSYDGRHRYRTNLRGWYLRADEGIAVGEDGKFYILAVRGSVRDLITGAHVAPARPRLVIGEGGRDGDRITLRTLLDRRLDG
jgi:hypothetical protein